MGTEVRDRCSDQTQTVNKSPPELDYPSVLKPLLKSTSTDF